MLNHRIKMVFSGAFFRLRRIHQVDLFLYATSFLSFITCCCLGATLSQLSAFPQQWATVALIRDLLAWYSLGSLSFMLFIRKLRFSPGGPHTAADKDPAPENNRLLVDRMPSLG